MLATRPIGSSLHGWDLVLASEWVASKVPLMVRWRRRRAPEFFLSPPCGQGDEAIGPIPSLSGDPRRRFISACSGKVDAGLPMRTCAKR